MKIVLDVAGGFAPTLMIEHYAVDTTALEEPDRRALETLVDSARREAPRPLDPSARDVRSYEIQIAGPAGSATIVAYDGAIPPATKQLIDTIRRLAPRSD
jgi:hypothetical protein